METATMGRVPTEATIENIYDLHDAERGLIPPEQVRRVTVSDALVDTGATILSLPLRLIQQLGLKKKYRKRVRSSAGVTETDIYGLARLTIQGRDCPTDVLEVADDGPVHIGQIPLEYLDFVVDLRNRRLIGNPEHGGEHMFEQY
jgi:predicted aspartyl protease